MLYPSIDKLLTKVDSKYKLVNLVSERVKEIKSNGHLQMNASEYKSAKNIGKALEEVSKGLIHLD